LIFTWLIPEQPATFAFLPSSPTEKYQLILRRHPVAFRDAKAETLQELTAKQESRLKESAVGVHNAIEPLQAEADSDSELSELLLPRFVRLHLSLNERYYFYD
jgi:hypothetical protein